METSTDGPRNRRNGQRPACEPCRKYKLKCDHATPVCGRCARLKRPQKCVYHPSPMTGRAAQLKQTTVRPFAHPRRLQPRANPPCADRTDLDRATGVVSMGNSGLPFTDMEWSTSRRETTSLGRNGLIPSSKKTTASPRLVADGVELLQFIFDSFPVCDVFITHFNVAFGQTGVFPSQPLLIISWHLVKALYEDSHATITPDRLQNLSQALFDNTAQTFRFPPRLEDLYHANLRWDHIGLYLAVAGTAVGAGSGRQFNNLYDGDRTDLLERCLEACLSCEAFCDRIGQITDLTAWIFMRATILATWCYGDDSYRAWQLNNSMASVIFALGLHRGTQHENTAPPYLVELRRRLIAMAHQIDKDVSIFVRRPARLSRQYCNIELPLDVTDEALMGDASNLEAARRGLDRSGWNTAGKILPASTLRAFLLTNEYREAVLDLSVSADMVDLEKEALLLVGKFSTIYESLPPFMHFESDTIATAPSIDAIALLGIQMEYLFSEFLLYKMLVHRLLHYQDEFLRTSYEIVNLMTNAISKRDTLEEHRIDLEWMVLFYAMPCASVLILELYRQKQQPAPTLIVSAGTIIRTLSVFISDCDWLSAPGQNNYEIFKQAEAVFSRALDLILNHSMTTATTKKRQNLDRKKHKQRQVFGSANAPTSVTEQWRTHELTDAAIASVPTPATSMVSSDPGSDPFDAVSFFDAELSSWLDSYDLRMQPWVFDPDNVSGSTDNFNSLDM